MVWVGVRVCARMCVGMRPGTRVRAYARVRLTDFISRPFVSILTRVVRPVLSYCPPLTRVFHERVCSHMERRRLYLLACECLV